VQLGDGLTQRRLVTSINPLDLTYNDVIAPSRVQVLVDLAGKVISTVLLPSDSGAEALGHWEFADQRALTLARAAHFTPGSQMTFGELIFNWHTLPTTNHNASP
jgi:hypothetical protein